MKTYEALDAITPAQRAAIDRGNALRLFPAARVASDGRNPQAHARASVFATVARPDRADHAARGASVLSGHPGGEGRARPRPTPTPSSRSASRCSAWRSPRLFYGSLSDRYGRRPVLLSGLALFLVGSVISALAQTPDTLVLGPADPGDRRRLRADAGARHRARRLPRRPAGQGDRLSHHVRHARPDGLADHRRRADRHVRLAQRVRLRAAGRRRRSRSSPIW